MDLKKILKKSGYTSLFTSLVAIAIGIILVLYPDATFVVISRILGIALIVISIIKIIEYVVQKGNEDFFNNGLIVGLMGILLGVVVIIKQDLLQNIVNLVIGCWIIYSSLMRFTFAIRLKSLNSSAWLPMLILATAILVCGICVVFIQDLIIKTIGFIIIAYAIMDIIESITLIFNIGKLQKLEKKTNEKIDEKKNEAIEVEVEK